MSNHPTVTVIIPTYNHAHFLREALKSLCDQTYTDWEAIVVNNYSEDDTVAVVASFDDPRIHLENFRNNGIIAASRNRALAVARGEYVAFLDSDDAWYPEKLEKCVRAFTPGVDLVCHGLRWFGDKHADVYCGPAQRASFEALLFEGSCITPSATLIRTAFLHQVGGFSEAPEVVTAEDYHLWLKLAQAGAGMFFIREILGRYRVHGGNQSGSAIRHMNAVLQVVNEFLPTGTDGVLATHRRIKRRYCLIYYGAGRSLQHGRHYGQAWKLFARAMACYPLFARTYAAMAINLFGACLKPFSKLHQGQPCVF